MEVERPAWLVLAESYNAGWRAECDGRDLGAPTPLDGFANGWQVPVGCAAARFYFAPQRIVTAGYAISALTGLALLALLAVGAVGRRRASPDDPELHFAAVRDTWRLPLRTAVAVGVAAGLVGGFLFALRAGVIIGPAVALLLWRGVGAARLALAAAVLAGVALPAVYLVFPPKDEGGFNAEYAADALGGHWIAVAVWVLFALALARSVPRLSASWRGSRSSR